MKHTITEEQALGALAVSRVPIASASGSFGRKSLDWEPYTCTFIVFSGEKLVCAGKDLKAAIEAYNAE